MLALGWHLFFWGLRSPSALPAVIEPLFRKPLPVLYDFDLMLNSGHLRGYAVDTPEDIAQACRPKVLAQDLLGIPSKWEGKPMCCVCFGVGFC